MSDQTWIESLAGGGQWEIVGRSGVLGTHAALMHTRSVLFLTRPEDPSHRLSDLDNGFPGDTDVRCSAISGIADTCLPDLSLGAIVDTDGPEAFKPRPTQLRRNPFCAGHCFLPDGRLLVAGGDKKDSRYYGVPEGVSRGLRSVRIFDPVREEWDSLPSMRAGRWYPTCTTLADGSIFIISGSLEDQQGYNNVNPTCETIPPMAIGPQFLPLLVEAWPQHSLPPTYVLPTGRLYVFACNRANYLEFKRDGAGDERWLMEEGARLTGQPGKLYPGSSTSVLLPLRPSSGYLAETLVIGGGGNDVYPHWGRFDDPASARCYRLVLDRLGTGWRQAAPMPSPRVMPDAVLLPDGTVLVVNGTRAGYAGGNAADGVAAAGNAVLAPDLYDPITNNWTTLAPATCPRLYHSTALLLPDATVLVAGSDQQRLNRDAPSGSTDAERRAYRAGGYEFRMERLRPPYLGAGPRPVIEDAPEAVDHGATFRVRVRDLGDGNESVEAVLIAPGAVTHGNNMSQRFVQLSVIARDEAVLTLEAPPSGWVAPPGYYMLFILRNGVPSEATFVRLEQTLTSGLSTSLPPAKAAAWFRADLGIELDEELEGIGTWADASGNGNDLFSHPAENDAQQTPPLQLLLHQINGQPVVHFPLVVGLINDSEVFGRFLCSNKPDFVTGTGPYSAFLVARPWPPGHRLRLDDRNSWDCSDLVAWGDLSPGGDNAFVALRLGSGPRRGEFPVFRGTASIHSYWRDEWRFIDQNGIPRDQLISLKGAMLIEWEHDGRDVIIRIDGSEIKRDPDVRNTRPGPLFVGRNGPEGAYYRGDLAEILIYDRVLKDSDRAEIHDYFNNRYALW